MSRLFIILIISFASSYLSAAEVNSLYQASIEVQSRDDSERKQLTGALLQQVLLKNVGNQAVLDQVDISAILSNAENYVQQYEYSTANQQIIRDLTEPDQLVLTVQFNETLVNRSIDELGLPRWGKVRPKILLWFANEANQTVYGLENIPQDLYQAIIVAAQRRGLAVTLPLMDLKDASQISYQDIAMNHFQQLSNVSQRYNIDVAVAAKLNPGETVSIFWSAELGNWQSNGSQEQAMQSGIGKLADILSQQYAQIRNSSAPTRKATLRVNDIHHYADYKTVLNFIEKQEVIDNIQTVKLTSGSVEFQLEYHGQMTVLSRSLIVGNILQAEPFSIEAGEKLAYRLIAQ